MSCPYCTPYVNEDGIASDFCKGVFYTSEGGGHKVDVRIEPWVDADTGERGMTILLAEQFAGGIVTSIPSPPYCPWCGERLK